MAGSKAFLFAVAAALAAAGAAFALRKNAVGTTPVPAPTPPPPGEDGSNGGESGGDFGGGRAVLVPVSLPTARVSVVPASGYIYEAEAKTRTPKRTGEQKVLSVRPLDSVRIQWGWEVRNTGTAPGAIGLQAQVWADDFFPDSLAFTVQDNDISGLRGVIKDVDRTVNPVTIYPGQSGYVWIGVLVPAKTLLDYQETQAVRFNWWVSKLYLYDYYHGDAGHPLKMTSGQDAVDTLRDWFKLEPAPGPVIAEPSPVSFVWL